MDSWRAIGWRWKKNITQQKTFEKSMFQLSHIKETFTEADCITYTQDKKLR